TRVASCQTHFRHYRSARAEIGRSDSKIAGRIGSPRGVGPRSRGLGSFPCLAPDVVLARSVVGTAPGSASAAAGAVCPPLADRSLRYTSRPSLAHIPRHSPDAAAPAAALRQALCPPRRPRASLLG